MGHHLLIEKVGHLLQMPQVYTVKETSDPGRAATYNLPYPPPLCQDFPKLAKGIWPGHTLTTSTPAPYNQTMLKREHRNPLWMGGRPKTHLTSDHTPIGVKEPWDPSMSDGCSFVPDYPDTLSCCTEHDRLYYLADGGYWGRRLADYKFRNCLSAKGHPARAWLWYIGVRTLGWAAWYNRGNLNDNI